MDSTETLTPADSRRTAAPQQHIPDDSVPPAALRLDDTGATTAEYAITTLAACGFAAVLVLVLKSDGVRELVTGVITSALGLGA